MKINRFIRCLGIISGVIVLSLGIFFFTTGEIYKPPSFGKVKAAHKKSDALLLDRYGRVIHERRIDSKGRRLDWVDLQAISPALIRTVLTVEDRRFYKHRGVDWLGLTASFFQNPLSFKMRGASTITMQLVSLLDDRLKPKGARRTLKQKRNQIQAALYLEKTWSKKQILEAYLNIVSYRSELQGIAAASRGLFGKDPTGIDEVESLILSALISSPNGPIDRIVRRACSLARSMESPPSCHSIKQAADEKLRSPYRIIPAASIAPQVARILLTGAETKVVSTIDGRLQRFALETLNQYLETLKGGHVFDGAILIIDHRTGEILAYVGNSGPDSSASFVDGLTAPRQAGSTLKPFLYELALEKGFLTAASLLEDSPLHVPTPNGLYCPENYDHLFRGPVSVRTALAASINIPAVRTLLLVGLDAFWDRLKQLGFESLSEESGYYGYSLALGSADITLYELTKAYTVLANMGLSRDLKISFTQKVRSPVRIMDQKAAFIISHILSDREARSTAFGLENPLSTRYWTAAKTGTSKDMRDNWCLGYSEKFTVGVWVGNFSGEPMRNVSGVSGAAPLWLEMMNYLHADGSSKPPKPPAGVLFAKASYHRDSEWPRKEPFVDGSQPLAEIQLNGVHSKPHIIYPTQETLISLDPEIPEDLQRVPFQYRPSAGRYEWVIDNQKTGITDPFFLWKPKPGNHVLSISDQKNRIIDTVGFVVR